MVICLERGADLHMAQLMPLPLTVSCFSKIQIGFTFLVPAHLGSHGKRAIKRVCVPSAPELSMLTTRLPSHPGGRRGNTIRTAECCVVHDSCAQRYAHNYEQFLNLHSAGVRLVFVWF